MTMMNVEFQIARDPEGYLIDPVVPCGYVKQACKIAGMQRPRVWSTG